MLADVGFEQSAGFAAFVGRFAARFPRVEARRQMRAYVAALLCQTVRKNSWTLARTAGEAGPERMQRLLNFYAWDSDGVRDDLRAVVVEVLGDARDGVLIVGETAFVKKGNKSAGVARQYLGTVGRTDNVQIGVFLAYASRHGQALIDRELYLPKEWTNDRDRCRRAGIDDDVTYATKPALAQRMIDRAARARVPFVWVTGDAAYGDDADLRMWLQAKDIAHVLEVSDHETGAAKPSAKGGPALQTPPAWVRFGLADQRGQKQHDWALLGIRALSQRRQQWLFARRSASGPTQITCYVGVGPAETTVAELARVAETRWATGACLRSAQHNAGLGDYKARSYQAWYRHMTLSMVAAVFLVITRNAARAGP